MEKNIKKAIENYQCAGCMVGGDTSCFHTDNIGIGCGQHYSGTSIGGIGKIFLGLPKSFSRLGDSKDMRPKIFNKFSEYGNYDKWNVACWKYKNEEGHTLVRGLMPRRNEPFIHIFLEDCLDKVNCYELTEEDINYMD